MTRILQPITSTWLDYPDKEDCSLVVVMMGCDNGCPLCQNPDFKNPNYAENTKEYTVDSLIEELNILAGRNKTNKIVLSGGDPLSCHNIKFTSEFLKKSSFDVCIYTGHSVEYAKNNGISGFKYMKCGLYMGDKSQESLKTDDYMQFASTNQQLFDSNYCCVSHNGVYLFK